MQQLAHGALYPSLGLLGQINTGAANPELDAALKKLVKEAMAPLHELEKRVGNPRSIPVLKERAMKSGADAACRALIRMGEPAQEAIIDVLETPPAPNNNPAYKMVRVYLEHFHELPRPIAPEIVEAIRTAQKQGGYSSSLEQYATTRLLRLIEGGEAVQGLRVSI